MFNDAFADPLGGVFSGMMVVCEPPRSRFDLVGRVRARLERYGFLRRTEERPGALFGYGANGDPARMLAPCGRPNGMGFSPDNRTFHFHGLAQEVFDFDAVDGRV